MNLGCELLYEEEFVVVGGGPPTMAQAGGKDPEKLADALNAGRKWIAEKL